MNSIIVLSLSTLTFFYTAIKQSDVDDVRDVLRYYKNHDDPIEAFRENQRKLQVFAHFNSLNMSYTR